MRNPRRLLGGFPRNLHQIKSLQLWEPVGTHGTPKIEDADAHGCFNQRLSVLADAYAERIAVCLESGDIGEAEARRIAEAEIGRRFVEEFITVEECRVP